MSGLYRAYFRFFRRLAFAVLRRFLDSSRFLRVGRSPLRFPFSTVVSSGAGGLATRRASLAFSIASAAGSMVGAGASSTCGLSFILSLLILHLLAGRVLPASA